MNYPPQEAQAPKPRKVYKPKPVTPLGQQATGIVNVPDVQHVQDEKSWLRQQGDDLMAIVTGIPNLLWHTAKSYGEMDYGAVLDGLTRDPVAVGRATQETLGQMLEGATAHWRGKDDKATFGSVLSAPVRRPILAGLDLLTVLSLGSAAGIKMAPLAGKVAAATKGADAAQYAAKWAGAFKAAQGFPLAATKAGLGRIGRLPVIKPLLESAGWDEFGLKATNKFHTAKMQITGRARDQLKPIIEQEIGKGMYDELIDIEAGYKALNPNIHPPEVVERMRAYSKVVKEMEEDGLRASLKAASGEYTTEMLEGSRLNHLRERMRSKGIPEDQLTDDLVKLHRDSVYAEADALGTGDIQRQAFWHAMVDNSTSVDDFIFNMLQPVGAQVQRKAGILERFLGGSRYVKNPNIRHANYVKHHNDLLGTIAGQRSLLTDPELSKVVRRAEIPDGWLEVPKPFIKNLDYEAEMIGMLNNRVAAAELKFGAGSPEAIAEAMVKASEDAGDLASRMAKDMVDGLTDDVVIAVPKGVQRFLNMELAPTGPFGRLYDKGMNFWRDMVLTFMPRYYVNNLLGNSLLMLLGGYKPGSLAGRQHEGLLGREMRSANFFVEDSGMMERIGASPHMARVRNALTGIQYVTENQPRALLALQKMGANLKDIKLTETLRKMVGLEGSAQPELSKVIELAAKLRELGVQIEGSMLSAARVEGVPRLQVSPGIPEGLRDPFTAQYEASVVPRTAEQIRTAIEGQKGYQRFLAEIEPLRAPVEEAYKWVETFLGPYGKITPLARKSLRRVIPFWTFGSTMARLMFHMPLLRPKTTWLYNSMSQMALDAWDDERLPDYLRGAVWVGTGKNGMLYFTRMTGFNPLESLSERKFGGVSIPALLDPTQSPLIGAILKMTGGYDQFSHNPPPLEPDQMIDHQGRVWDIDPRTGSPKRVSPQTPFLDALGEMIPQTSIINDIMAHSGFQVPGRGPKLYQMPDGTMFNPRHWQWGLANGLMRSFGANVMPVDLAKAKAQQRMQAIRLIRHLGKQAVRAAEPEERAQFMKMAKYALEGLHAK